MNIGDLVQSTDDSDLIGIILACGDTNNGYFVRWVCGHKDGYVSYELPKWITSLSATTEIIK
jgi:hypothetical protein